MLKKNMEQIVCISHSEETSSQTEGFTSSETKSVESH